MKEKFLLIVSFIFSINPGKKRTQFFVYKLLAPLALLVASFEGIGQSNLIYNGDFSLGNVGFTSGYGYVCPACPINEGQYTVLNTVGCTGGSQLKANGVANIPVWQQTINSLTPNTLYTYSVKVRRVYPVKPSQIKISVNGIESPVLILTGECPWQTISLVWNSMLSSSAILRVIDVNGIASGNDFYIDDLSFIAYNLIPLPVKFADISLSGSGANVIIKWVTLSEQNSDRFEIEMSINGQDFNSVGVLAGGGNSAPRKDYSYNDINRLGLTNSDIYYYRIKQVDIDGNYSYSPVMILKSSRQSGITINVTPNPFINTVYVSCFSPGNRIGEIRIINMNGVVVSRQKIALSRGNATTSINNASTLPPGMYIAEAITNEETSRIKILKLK